MPRSTYTNKPERTIVSRSHHRMQNDARGIDNTYMIARETSHEYILCDLYYIIKTDASFRSNCNNIIIVNE